MIKSKHNKDGFADRYKARLMAKGYHQRPGLDFSETFLVVKPITIYLVLLMAVSYKWEVRQ